MLTLGTKDGHARPRKDPLFSCPGGTDYLWWAAQYLDGDVWKFFAGAPDFKTRTACLRWIADLRSKATRLELPDMRPEPFLMQRGKS